LCQSHYVQYLLKVEAAVARVKNDGDENANRVGRPKTRNRGWNSSFPQKKKGPGSTKKDRVRRLGRGKQVDSAARKDLSAQSSSNKQVVEDGAKKDDRGVRQRFKRVSA